MVKIILDPSWDNNNNCSDCATSLPYTLTTIHPRKRARSPVKKKTKSNAKRRGKSKTQSKSKNRTRSESETRKQSQPQKRKQNRHRREVVRQRVKAVGRIGSSIAGALVAGLNVWCVCVREGMCVCDGVDGVGRGGLWGCCVVGC